MNSRHHTPFSGTSGACVLAAAFVVAVVGTPAFGSPIFFKNNVPDFYQHQKSGPDTNVPLDNDLRFGYAGPAPGAVPSYDTTPEFWEQRGGWCCVAAFVDSFYFLEKTYGITGLFTRPDKEAKFEKDNMRKPTWQEQMIFAIEDLAQDMGLDGMTPIAGTDRIPTHVRKLQAAAKFPAGGPDKLTYTEFDVTAGFGTGTPTVTRQDANAASRRDRHPFRPLPQGAVPQRGRDHSDAVSEKHRPCRWQPAVVGAEKRG
jgi:hypothetical protein